MVYSCSRKGRVRRCVWPTTTATTTNPPASASPPQWLQREQKPEGHSPLIARPAVFSPSLSSSSNIPRPVTCISYIYVYNIYIIRVHFPLCNTAPPHNPFIPRTHRPRKTDVDAATWKAIPLWALGFRARAPDLYIHICFGGVIADLCNIKYVPIRIYTIQTVWTSACVRV